jgi:hypothetical protein
MLQILTWVVKSVAVAYGLFALGTAILYSLSRVETWKRPTKAELQELQKGTMYRWTRRLHRPN